MPCGQNTQAPGPVYLVDGSGYIFRAYYAIRPLSTSTGVPTHAVLGFARMMLKLMREEQPRYLGIAFDTPEKTFRHAIYPAYKANREAPPEDLIPQFPLIHELVSCMGIPPLVCPGYEADDVLATLARQATSSGHPVVIASGDKDLMQLVGAGVRLWDPMKEQSYDSQGVQEKLGVAPENVPDLLALAGDSSDNIPGVRRVGPKSAAKLISQHGDLDQILAALTQQEKLKAFERAVLSERDQAILSKRLTVLEDKAPVTLNLESLRYQEPLRERLGPFLRRIEAFALLRELGWGGEDAPKQTEREEVQGGAVSDEAPPRDPIDRSRYRSILLGSELDALVARARTSGRLSVDLETTSVDPNRADIVGVALCVPGEAPAYVPVAHRYLGAPPQLSRQDVIERLRPLLADPNLAKIGQNLKYEHVVLARAGVQLAGIGDDSMLMAYVLDASRSSYSLDALSREILGHENIRYKDVTSSGRTSLSFDQVSLDVATQYAAEDADVALRLCDAMRPKMEAQGLSKLYRELELPLISVLAGMERSGVLVDVPHLRQLGREFAERLVALERQAEAMAGERINLASPKQLARLLFGKLGYPPVKKTKTGYSTDQEVLETLARSYDLPAVVLEHRLLAKLKSTYVDGLCRMVNPETGRVHTSYNQTGTATGRLSSSDPNLQNIPVRSEDGRRIRASFMAEPGWELVAADYSQVELRVLAHLSGDKSFVAAFRCGEDIHGRTAAEVLGDVSASDPEARRRAKAINFGIIYGLSEYGLAKQLGIAREDARAYISAYFARYPGIREYLDRCVEEARKRGFATTMAGRRRYLPELHSKNRTVRQGAERVAMNTTIQGSAADLIKLAMLKVRDLIEAHQLRARVILQVHDELVLEAPQEEREAVVALVQEGMARAIDLDVPLVVDVGWGNNWAAAH